MPNIDPKILEIINIKKPLSEFEAFFIMQINSNNDIIKLSINDMAKKFGWNRTKVYRYINYLIDQKILEKIKLKGKKKYNLKINKNNISKNNDKNIVTTPTRKLNFEESYSHFLTLVNMKFKKKYRGDKISRQQFKILLKKDITAKMVEIVINNIYKDYIHIENKYRYVTPEYITREHIFERYLNIKN